MSIWSRYILWNIVAEFNLLICDNTANGSAFLPDNIAAKGTVTSLERHVGVPKVCSWDLWSWQFTLWLSYLHIGKEPFCSERLKMSWTDLQKDLEIFFALFSSQPDQRGGCFFLSFKLHDKLCAGQDRALGDVWCAIHKLIPLHVLP